MLPLKKPHLYIYIIGLRITFYYYKFKRWWWRNRLAKWMLRVYKYASMNQQPAQEIYRTTAPNSDKSHSGNVSTTRKPKCANSAYWKSNSSKSTSAKCYRKINASMVKYSPPRLILLGYCSLPRCLSIVWNSWLMKKRKVISISCCRNLISCTRRTLC